MKKRMINDISDADKGTVALIAGAVVASRLFKGLKPRQIQEILAIREWLTQNDPEWSDPFENVSKRDQTPKKVAKK